MSGLLLLCLYAAAEDLRTLPTGVGLPILVRTATYFVDIDGIDESAGTFEATVDLRLRWKDARLAYPGSETPVGFREWRGAAAEEALTTMWCPDVVFENAGEQSDGDNGLRVYPDGSVEWLRRTTAAFSSTVDVSRFPFDRQLLRVEVLSKREPQSRVQLDFCQEDLSFSGLGDDVSLDGWELGSVDLQRMPQTGWHGDRHARVEVSASIRRIPGGAVASIFIPLFASLFIPILALWLNESEEDGFKVEAFELANVLIGGLFAIIALNFTVNSTYAVLAGDNPVSRLFVLNYVLLAVSFGINIGVFRFKLVNQWFGKHVQQEFYRVLTWGLPSLVTVAAGWVLWVAAG